MATNIGKELSDRVVLNTLVNCEDMADALFKFAKILDRLGNRYLQMHFPIYIPLDIEDEPDSMLAISWSLNPKNPHFKVDPMDEGDDDNPVDDPLNVAEQRAISKRHGSRQPANDDDTAGA
jgi:hypothetical protein